MSEAASFLPLVAPAGATGQQVGIGQTARAPDTVVRSHGEAPRFALDLRLGVTSGSTELGASTGVPDGIFDLRDLDAAPRRS